jgi:carbamoyltransferase
MACVLGVSGLYHDAAAALLIDGKLVAAVQEERLSRTKNDPRLPLQAITCCLEIAEITPQDVERIVFYEQPFPRLERVLVSMLRAFPRSFRQFPTAIAAQLREKIWVKDQLSDALGIDRKRVTCTEHHRSHAAWAWFASPFEQAAILSVDGVGEDASTVIWHAKEGELRLVEQITFPHSLGLFYAALTAYLGFEVNEGEYKVMGLAAYGKPEFQDEFSKLIQVYPDGSFELGLPYFAYESDTLLGFSKQMEQLLGPRRPPNKAWEQDPLRPGHFEQASDQRYANIAATLQLVTEQALLQLAKRALQQTGESNLCLTGGVALNAVANARLARESGCSHLFVPPAAGDAGAAVGAAYVGAVELGDKPTRGLESAALGANINVDRVWKHAKELGFSVRRVENPTDTCVELLSRGAIVAWAQGRWEFGPRALGQRSFLALPSDPNIRERLNRVVKRREPFRPFAPATLTSEASNWFLEANNPMTRFMATVCPVVTKEQSSLAAVTHVDGTARVQCVAAQDSPELFAVLTELAKRGLPPIVLNTSLNGAGEPIAASAEDILCCFAAHPVDAALVGDVIVERKS